MTFINMPTVLSKVELIAVLVATTEGQPKVVTVNSGQNLPCGPLELNHDSIQSDLRDWILTETGHPVGFIEQLYTSPNRDRLASSDGIPVISISYLGLLRETDNYPSTMEWENWYDFFPWDDCRTEKHQCVDEITDRLYRWASKDSVNSDYQRRRISFLFGCNGYEWNEDFILQRYEILYESGLIAEAGGNLYAGKPMYGNGRRILATAIASLRRKIKHQAIIFDLLPEKFTLLQLQQTVEAIIGRNLHKPNFRRLTEQQGIIEEIGEQENRTGGRPAKLYRYRQEIIESCIVTLSRFPLARQ